MSLFTTETAQAFLEENFAPWVRALDLTIREISAERTVMAMPITDQVARVGGILSGQAMATIADTAMVFASLAQFDTLKLVSTTNLDVQYLRPGVGDALRCEAEVVRAGKSLIFTRATMISEPSQKPVATATATFFTP